MDAVDAWTVVASLGFLLACVGAQRAVNTRHAADLQHDERMDAVNEKWRRAVSRAHEESRR